MEEIEDRLSPEEIAAATKKPTATYYAYYDKLGNIVSVSNDILESQDNFIQITFDVFENFVTGRELFSNWVVNKTKNSSNDLGVELVLRSQQSKTFKNNMFEIIRNPRHEDNEVIVHWDGYYKQWIFEITDDARQRIYDNEIGTKLLTFYVVYEHSFEFLVRTIEIPINKLIYDKILIPFEHAIEEDFNKISISTKSVFRSYGISVWRVIKDEQNSSN